MIGVREPIPGVVYLPDERLTKYVESGALPQLSLIEALRASFRTNAQHVAIYTPEGEVTYAELDDITNRFAASLLGLGLRPLDRVLFQAGNSKELIFSVLGCLKAGLIPVCTLAAHREREIGYLGRHVDARAHIVHGDDPKFDLQAFALRMRETIPTMKQIISIRGALREGISRFEDLVAREESETARASVDAAPRDPFQVAIFQLSGGTSGIPKVIPRMQNDYLLNALLTVERLGYRPDDVMFMQMPMIHNAAMICIWLPALLIGAAFTIAENMTPEAWGRAIGESNPTWIGLIRALLPRLEAVVDQGLASLDSVRACWCPDAARVVRERFGIPTYALFGMSEGLNMYTREGDSERVLDWTVGTPLSPYDEVRLIEPGTDTEVEQGEIGELVCRGPYTTNGYFNAPERNHEVFTKDGFYKTGDLLIQNEIDGQLCYAFAGRTKDVVDRGSEKVNCEEIETAVSTHAAVATCAVVGMPDPVLGERVCAYVVVKNDCRLPGVAELAQHLERLGLAKFKWPERVVVVEELPLTKVGKLDKAVLRTQIRELLEMEGLARGEPQKH